MCRIPLGGETCSAIRPAALLGGDDELLRQGCELVVERIAEAVGAGQKRHGNDCRGQGVFHGRCAGLAFCDACAKYLHHGGPFQIILHSSDLTSTGSDQSLIRHGQVAHSLFQNRSPGWLTMCQNETAASFRVTGATTDPGGPDIFTGRINARRLPLHGRDPTARSTSLTGRPRRQAG